MHEGITSFLTITESWYGVIPLLIVLIPIIGAIKLFLLGKNERLRNYILIGTTVITFGLVLLMYTAVINGVTISGHQYKGIYLAVPYLPGFNMTFRVDPAGFLLAAITSFIYMVSCIYSTAYMKIEGRELRYAICSLITLATNMGVVLAGDFLTLFLFFEGLVIFPYFMFAHREDADGIRGANIYLYLGVVTGLSLLMGIIMLYNYTGSINIGPMAETINASMPGNLKYWMAALMIIGFGGKAGLFLEHFWMPSAYPASPSPTPSMSSGAMIKAGAYGIFRVANLIFIPEHGAVGLPAWLTASNIGYVLIWVGVVTMFLGVLNALISANSNRMLAYHSVSQMGYIVMGIGVAAYLGRDGAMGLAGALYHIVNHSLFKASLFLGVGAVYFRTRELDMYKLGGLWRNMPVTAIGLLIAVFGISGIPLFNGFASKTILHEAIIEAYDYTVSLGHPDSSLKWAEIIFIITAAGTFASNMKLFVLTFLRARPEKYKDVKPAPTAMKVSIGILSFAILFIGIFPNWMLETVIGPALSYFNFDSASHGYELLYDIHTRSSGLAILSPGTQSFSNVLHNLLGGADAILLGGVMFILGLKFGWFHIHIPETYTVGFHYQRMLRLFKQLCRGPIAIIAAYVEKGVSQVMVNTWLPLVNPASLIKSVETKLGIDAEKKKIKWQVKFINCCLRMTRSFWDFDAGVVDSTVNDVSDKVYAGSRIFRKVQTGFIQNYLLVMVLGVFLLITFFVIL